MAALPHTGVVGIFHPRPLPMDKDVDVVLFDDDPFDHELKRNGVKRLEVHLRLALKVFHLIRRQHHGLKARPIFSLIGAPQGVHGLIDAKEPLVLCRVLNGF